jgi:hypothetical protein
MSIVDLYSVSYQKIIKWSKKDVCLSVSSVFFENENVKFYW